ncbi:hypothetical protein SDRG_11553 [Saprolegnia diclina VS20]|uniref:Uncharacterized protein n=1 Tax=Saprolegnia diclina (strain VS20) TaxID=1156394 RepID=T0RLE8_SAPDV|nr:hypothetical protein SDRG_11553 [Saprolegnia diclina VS20]EQC30792.1 hypothetical protein SDRG_11553 [Saprolegnia diclina VS20]|eukprot:XP_008615816.1 hypothetical protein SDRG_11553 [Saprolegnia diclina VS20]
MNMQLPPYLREDDDTLETLHVRNEVLHAKVMALTKQVSQAHYELRIEKVLHRETKGKLKSAEAALEAQVRQVFALEAALEEHIEAQLDTLAGPLNDIEEIHREELEMLQDDVDMYMERCASYEETIAKLRTALEDNALGQTNDWILRQQSRASYYLDEENNDCSDVESNYDDDLDADGDEECDDSDDESESESEASSDDEIFAWKSVDLRGSCSEDTASLDSDYELEQARLAQLCAIVTKSVNYETEYLAVVDQIEAKLEEESLAHEQQEMAAAPKTLTASPTVVRKTVREPKDWLDDLLFEVAQLNYAR